MARTRTKAEPKQAEPEMKQVTLTDEYGNPSESVVLRPGETSMKDVQRRKQEFELAWENHRAQTGGDPTTGKGDFYETWIKTYEEGGQ